MGFEISIESFAGPLDLMLHLIKENKLDLFDLDVSVLCDQYLAYINASTSMNLEIASEYLSELAGLIEYKSKKLLPKEVIEISEEYEEDQRERLVQRLLEYQKFKEATKHFSTSYDARKKMMEKPISKETERWVKQVQIEEYEGNPYDLIKAMNRVIRRFELSKPLETNLTIEELSVDERLQHLQQRLAKYETKVSFDTLCMDCTSLHMIIVSFLAILNLIKEGLLAFTVENNTIWLIRGNV